MRIWRRESNTDRKLQQQLPHDRLARRVKYTIRVELQEADYNETIDSRKEFAFEQARLWNEDNGNGFQSKEEHVCTGITEYVFHILRVIDFIVVIYLLLLFFSLMV